MDDQRFLSRYRDFLSRTLAPKQPYGSRTARRNTRRPSGWPASPFGRSRAPACSSLRDAPAPTRSSAYSHGCALQRLGTPGMRQIGSTRVVHRRPGPVRWAALVFKNVRLRRQHGDLEGSASAALTGRQMCGSPSRCATRRRRQRTAAEDARDGPSIDPQLGPSSARATAIPSGPLPRVLARARSGCARSATFSSPAERTAVPAAGSCHDGLGRRNRLALGRNGVASRGCHSTPSRLGALVRRAIDVQRPIALERYPFSHTGRLRGPEWRR